MVRKTKLIVILVSIVVGFVVFCGVGVGLIDKLLFKDEFDFKGPERMEDPVKVRKKWDKLPDNMDKAKPGG